MDGPIREDAPEIGLDGAKLGKRLQAVCDADAKDLRQQLGKVTLAEFLGQTKQTCGLRCDEKFMRAAFADILAGGAANFKLQPKDVVYVANRPWYKAEELLDSAVSAFITAAIVTYTGQQIQPLIKHPIFD